MSVAACFNCGAKEDVRCVDDRCCERDDREAAFAAEPTRIWIRWSDDGEHIRRWSRAPFRWAEPVDAIDAPPAPVDLSGIHHDALLAELQRRLAGR